MLKQVKKKDEDGNTIICTVDENGVEQGPFEIRYKDGNIGKGTYKDGNWDGPYEDYYKSGQVCQKCNYKDGWQEGLFEEYCEDGSLRERCTYREGKKDGLSEEYNGDGTLASWDVYIGGNRVSIDNIPIKAVPHMIQQGFMQLQAQISQMAAEMAQMKELMGQEKAQEAVEKLKEEKQVSEKIGNLKGRLEMISDPAFRKPIGPARTPERQAKAEEIIEVRRARTLLSRAAQQAAASGDRELLGEIEKIARPYALHKRRLELEQKQKRMERREKKGRE